MITYAENDDLDCRDRECPWYDAFGFDLQCLADAVNYSLAKCDRRYAG